MGKVVAAIGSTKGSARAQIDAPGLDDSFSSSSDLGGTYASPIVEGIQGNPVAASPSPALGQIIYWDGAQWYPGGPGGDLDGDYPSPIVVGLRGNPVGAGSPLTNQVLTWNGTEWVPGSSAAGGGGGGIAYFLDADNPGQAPVTNLPNVPNPPKKLAVNADADDVHVDYGPLPTGGVYDFIVGFVTDVGTPGLDAYPAGIWDLNLWAESAGSASGDVKFLCKVYLYDGVNPPVFLAQTDPTALYSPADSQQYTASVIIPPTVVSSGTRLYLELEASALVPGRSIRFHFGDGHPSYIRTSLPSVSGTGIVKVVNGAFQTPATPVYLNTADVNGILPVANGGTGLGTIPTDGQLLIGNGTGFTEAALTAGTGISITNGPGSILIDNTGVTSVDVSGGLTGLTTSGGPVLTTGTITLDGTLNVGHGGTGLNTAPANGEILVGNGTGFTSTTLTAGTGMSVTNGSGSITLNNTGVTSVDVSGGATGLTFSGGPVLTTGTVTMAGTLGVPNGGTGLTASGASGNVLVSNGTALASVPVSKDGTLNSAGQLTVTGVQGTQFSSTPPTSGQLMQYNAGTGQWTPTTPAAILQTTYTAIYATENINRGDVVVATNAGGSPAGYIAVAKASALTADLSFPVVGISDSNLTTLTPLTRLGNAVITGLISGIDTHLLTQRRPGYISPTTPGGLTSTKPSTPNYVFQVGYCIDQSGAAPPFNGSFWVSPQSIINTANLNDVTAPAPVENDLLIYKSATSLWTSAPLLKAAQTQTAVNLNAGNTITNAMIANVVYLPIRTNNNITLGANPIDVLTTADYGRMLWLHNVSNARSITLSAGGTTWLEGGVNLVLPANTMAKFMWLNVGGGAGRWVQTDKAITAF